MEIRKGYKKTDFGDIPDEWIITDINSVSIDMLQGVNTAIDIPEYVEDGIPMLKANNIIDGTVKFETSDHVSVKTYTRYSERFKLKKFDFLFSNIGARLGTGSLLDRSIDSTFAWNVMRIIPNPNLIQPAFLGHIMNSKIVYSQIINNVSGSGMGFVPKNVLKGIKLILPTKIEQELISQALTDIDKLITNLEKIIEKKRQIKQGVMKELLTPKVDWISYNLEEICVIKKGQQINKSTLTQDGDFPVMNGGISSSGFTSQSNQNENTIIISEGGNSCGFVNFIKTKFWQGGHCYSIETRQDTDFLYHLMKFKEKDIMSLRVGSGLPNIQLKRLSTFQLYIPEKKFQIELAEIFNSFDLEIKTLIEKLNKTKELKHSMLQNLLTGKIRLI